jgi:hypothetical protein
VSSAIPISFVSRAAREKPVQAKNELPRGADPPKAPICPAFASERMRARAERR